MTAHTRYVLYFHCDRYICTYVPLSTPLPKRNARAKLGTASIYHKSSWRTSVCRHRSGCWGWFDINTALVHTRQLTQCCVNIDPTPACLKVQIYIFVTFCADLKPHTRLKLSSFKCAYKATECTACFIQNYLRTHLIKRYLLILITTRNFYILLKILLAIAEN